MPFHSIQFVLSHQFLDALAEDLEAPPISTIGGVGTIAVRDSVLAGAGTLMVPLLATPDDVDELLAGHIMLSFSTYVCAKYGDLRTPRLGTGGLSRWQKRVADEAIEAHLASGVSLEYLASLCDLRVSQFAHGFRRSAGVAPYQWLQHRRIEKAKTLLRARRLSITDISLACGFSDQSHLTRVFRRFVGASPALWQSQQLGGMR